MIYRKYHKGDKVHSLDEHLEKKLESMEFYYIRQIASMVAKEKILIPRIHVKDDTELYFLITDYMAERAIGIRIYPTELFIKEVMEYIHLKAGQLHIKQYLVPKAKKQKSLDEIFWT